MWIETTEENKELWNWVSFLRDPANVSRVLYRRVANAFFLPALPSILPTIATATVKRASARVASSIRQAEELWRAAASEGVTPVSLPILLFYGAESLAAALIYATFDTDSASGVHGLRSENRHRSLRVEEAKNGLFRRFHECYSLDANIYGTKWNLRQLLSVNIDITREFYLGYKAKPHINLDIDHLDEQMEVTHMTDYRKPYKLGGKVRPLHPLDYRFLTLFILSNYARYEPTGWLGFLNSPHGFVARAFLAKTYRRFPNLFLNAFWGEEFIFSPAARLAGPPEMPPL